LVVALNLWLTGRFCVSSFLIGCINRFSHLVIQTDIVHQKAEEKYCYTVDVGIELLLSTHGLKILFLNIQSLKKAGKIDEVCGICHRVT